MRLLTNQTIDSMLEFIAENGRKIHLVSGPQTTYATVDSNTIGFYLVDTGVTAPGEYVIADSGLPEGGRVLTVPGTTNAGVINDGTVDHVAITNGSDTLYYITEVDAQDIVSGSEVIVDPFEIYVEDPVA